MNIDWKARLTNKAFWVAIVSAMVLLTQQLGYNIFPSNWSDILNIVLTIFILLGIVVDPSTNGVSDEKKEIVQIPENKQEIINTGASAKIQVDNPDNIQKIGATVNTKSASLPD